MEDRLRIFARWLLDLDEYSYDCMTEDRIDAKVRRAQSNMANKIGGLLL